MAKLEEYRQYIQNLLKQHASMVWDKRIQAQTIFDLENNHYQLIYVGWRDQTRIYGPVLHLDIIDDKILRGYLESLKSSDIDKYISLGNECFHKKDYKGAINNYDEG
ncbi:element excision factor XisI family protein [Aphanizomenon flos-aquae NRERC-008]|uniref:XisI protein n=1 Tax=Aphanizomenon flos-aquae FACHB-1249 TaxID=2692889 RepID=A0ABR8IT46_APHFL|nr:MULTISPECIES: element excision factor XisI family protein [Aphanizomenon]MBD2391809.1 XisI protein [Aphanizomenon flos-aquae FACHB-1171]MBD2558477.1 XisI protein [Aphanizomenon flos-aquae FACHB-1290]MBD2632718.1 XisI protein [Aphanizomenon sp. FACHB-1399]MBD2643537.1 XisI protein [Aphanizomenon sp. FACHB-1401]MBD2658428.1 XisI protein [Aphanizomenon flos-aquae FACHB-1265]